MSDPLTYARACLKRAAENGYPWSVSPDEAAALVAEVDRLRAEVDAERAAVVAWLGAEVDAAMDMHLPVRAATLLACAEAIERGEHRREEGR